ncbi:MAG TPA: hypothetical protein VGR45_10965 [Stellaceae bacterium]|nr:hypothetical protein [Stellaceae bacterium]
MTPPIHPFPARMAPELALEKLRSLPVGSLVLDPMAGSGTVLRQATDLRQKAIGFDSDPLAVLMTRAWTTPVDDDVISGLAQTVMKEVVTLETTRVSLPWIDDDAETTAFITYWFTEPQREELRRLAHVLHRYSINMTTSADKAALDVLKLALSRIIVTKDKGVSLARDVSHSRPHRVVNMNSIPVRPAFERSVRRVRKLLVAAPPYGGAEMNIGDARSVGSIHDGSIDAVLTSPPYLNAIDYMRGHRMSLVWLGHTLADLRAIRSTSIGSERAPETRITHPRLAAIREAIGNLDALPVRFARIVDRYVQDISNVIAEISRVLRIGGHATFVVGNSCLRGVFIQNSEALVCAAELSSLRQIDRTERPLPLRSRYLPMTSKPLAKRMRTETILSFTRM